MGWSQYHKVGLIHHAPEQAFAGYTLLATVTGSGAGDAGNKYTTLVDMEGRVCHRWEAAEGISHAHLLPNGNLLARTWPSQVPGQAEVAPGGSTALVELDWESNVVWEYRHPMFHHDYARLPNGTTGVLLWERLSPELSAMIKGGFRTPRDPEQMLGDLVREVAPDGSVVHEWRSWEHLSIDEDVICPLEGRAAWTHGNSLDVTPSGDLVVGYRQTSTLGLVNRESGEFSWKWGPGLVSHQHDVRYLPNGNVLLLDNGAHRRGISYSRVVEVNPATSEIVWQYRGDPPISFFSFNMGGAQRLPNGNTLICEGAAGRLLEVTHGGDIVWEYINPFPTMTANGNVSNSVFKASRYGSDDPALAGRDLDPERFAGLNRLFAGG